MDNVIRESVTDTSSAGKSNNKRRRNMYIESDSTDSPSPIKSNVAKRRRIMVPESNSTAPINKVEIRQKKPIGRKLLRNIATESDSTDSTPQRKSNAKKRRQNDTVGVNEGHSKTIQEKQEKYSRYRY